MLIGLWGAARSGKDTVATILVEDYGYHRMAFADKVRKVALAADPWIPTGEGGVYWRLSTLVAGQGWDGAKENPEVRRFLQHLGAEGVRDNLGLDTWVDIVFADKLRERIVITDMRFPNEYAAIKTYGGGTVKISRPGYSAVNGHVSEMALARKEFDYELFNDAGLPQLRADVHAMMYGWNVLALLATSQGSSLPIHSGLRGMTENGS